MKLINAKDISACLSFKEAVDVFRCALANDDVVSDPSDKLILPLGAGNLALTMPAVLSSKKMLGIKLATYFPDNPQHALPAIHSIMAIYEIQTGSLLGFIDGESITAIKTAALTALVVDLVCPLDASSFCMYGSGVQAKKHIEAFLAIRPIQCIHLYSRSNENAVKLADELNTQFPELTIDVFTDAAKAAESVNFLCFCTSHSQSTPILTERQIAQNQPLFSIGGASDDACEFPPELLSTADIISDNPEACLQEAGEIRAALQHAWITAKQINPITTLLPERVSSKRVIYRSVGNAIFDVILSQAILDIATQKNLGKVLDYF